MTDPLQIAILGYWHVHARDYATDAAANPDTRVVAVWDDDAARGQAGATSLGVPFEPDLDALLARPELDAVVVTTATVQHRDVMVKAAAAGKHIFTEKVLAPTVAEAEEIVAAADARRRPPVRLAAAAVHTATPPPWRRIVDAGRSASSLRTGPAVPRRLASRRAGCRSASSIRRPPIGGALTDLGCHPVYLMQRFLGAHPETVSATYRPCERSRRSRTTPWSRSATPAARSASSRPASSTAAPFTRRACRDAGPCATRATRTGSSQSGRRSAAGAGRRCRCPPTAPARSTAGSSTSAPGTRADDNLARAVELTRLVVAANEAAATGRTIPYRSPTLAPPEDEVRMEHVKVGLIGGGGIADAHVRGYRRSADRIGVTAVADPVPRDAGSAGATSWRPQRSRDYRRADRRRRHRRRRHLPAPPPAPRRDRRGGRGRQAHPVREAALPHARRRRVEVRAAVASSGRHPDVRPQPAVPAGRRQGARRCSRPAILGTRLRGPHDRQLLQRLRPGEHGLAGAAPRRAAAAS